MEIVEDEVENAKSSQLEDDFANLIIPNNIYPSKLSKLKSNFVSNKNPSVKKKQEMKKKSVAECNDNIGLIIPTNNSQSTPKITEYRNGVIIEEL